MKNPSGKTLPQQGGIEHSLLDAVLQAFRDVLEQGSAAKGLPDSLEQNEQFQELLSYLAELQNFAMALSNGDLSQTLHVKGKVAGSLKNLQANLRHLSWKAKMIAQGDLSQRVDFMGEFSNAFNSMVASLDEMHRELRESEQFNTAVINNSPIGISVRSRTGQLLFANEAWKKIWAIPEADVLADKKRNRSDLVFDARDEYLQPHHKELRQVYEHGGHLHLPELHTIHPRPGAAEWISQHFYAIQDEYGRVDRVVVLTEDITKRKKVENAEHEQRVLAESLRDIAAALNSTLDVEHVLDILLANVGRVVPHDTASIMMLEEKEKVYVVRERGYAERGLKEKISASYFDVSGMPYLKKMLESAQPVLVPDTSRDGEWGARTIAQVSSYAGVPIVQKGEVRGFINLGSETAGFFTPAHLERLRAFADQAAIAIENARLYEQSQGHARQMTSLYQIGLSITSKLDRSQIFHALYTQIQQVLAPNVFYIAIYTKATHIIEHPLFYDSGELRNVPPRDIRKVPGLTGEVILSRKTIYINDALNPGSVKNHQVVHIGGKSSRTYVGVPMIMRDHVVGVLSIQSYETNAFSAEQVRLLETIAAQAAVAVENSILFDQARQEIKQRRSAQRSQQKVNKEMQERIKQIEKLEAELREQAIRDVLTGLFNRRYLQETLEREIARAIRRKQPVGIIMMDIDLFKVVNDTYGHKAGDLVLQALGDLLKTNLRAEDIICRYGGEEFVVVMPGASIETAQERAEFIRHEFEAMHIPFENHEIRATLSLGLAAYPLHAIGGEEVLIRADRALYHSKQTGRNRLTVYHDNIRMPLPKF
ncbi:MAG: diguanylate cyclase [Chloroflexi bacterium]|nr:MAG: diguanylate cyclase [Chloroflexota bacterium]